MAHATLKKEDRKHGTTPAGLMKAFVMRKIGEVGVMEKPIPEPGPDEVLVKTTAALVCTSDCHTVGGAIGERENITLGHESVGVISKLGSSVKGFTLGQRVAVNAITPCYRCENCLRGFTSQCGQALGGWKFANVRDGNMAEYFLVNDAVANLAPIPAEIPDELAVYTCDMMSTGLLGAEHAAVVPGGTVAVFGQGPVGLMATAMSKLLGAAIVIAVETVPARKELARRFGADFVVDFKQLDAAKAIVELTEGLGVDSAIEALGSQATFEGCVKATRPGGTISNVGYHGHGDTVNIPRLDWGVGMADKTIRTGLCPGGAERMKRLLRLLTTKRIDPSPLTTHRFPFAEIEKAFKMMQTKEDGILKPLIRF